MKRQYVIVAGIMWFAAFASANDESIDAKASQLNQIDTREWAIHEIKKIGIRFKLPKTYKEKTWEVTIGTGLLKTFRSDPFSDLSFEEESGPGDAPERQKLTRQPEYTAYKESSFGIGKHKVFVQSFGGSGIRIDENGEVSTLWQVEVLCGLEADRLLRISARTGTKKGQEEILAMIRTLEFSDESKPTSENADPSA